jgi:hypothetical protein
MSEMDQSVPTATRLRADDEDTKAPTTGQTLTRMRDWVYKNPAPSLTIAGVLVYTLLRVNYALFYGRLGVTPEDVGLTYVSILIQTIGVLAGTAYLLVYMVLELLPSLLGLLLVPIGGALGLLLKRPLLKYAISICVLVIVFICLFDPMHWIPVGVYRPYRIPEISAIL